VNEDAASALPGPCLYRGAITLSFLNRASALRFVALSGDAHCAEFGLDAIDCPIRQVHAHADLELFPHEQQLDETVVTLVRRIATCLSLEGMAPLFERRGPSAHRTRMAVKRRP
jgi:hypothetical protein